MNDKELEKIINDAIYYARTNRHSLVTVEHLLLALLDNSSALDLLKACGANKSRLYTNLIECIHRIIPVLPANSTQHIEISERFKRVTQRAIAQAKSLGNMPATGAILLAAILAEQEGETANLLRQENISEKDVIDYISENSRSNKFDVNYQQSPFSQNSDEQEEDQSKDPLELYATNLNKRAKKGLIEPLIGREEEIDRVIQVLCRRQKNNPLLIGEAGVGKTAIAEGLARLIVEEKVPFILRDSVIYSLDLGLLIAGTKYRGDFEQRLKNVLNRLKELKGAILFIDEIHTIIGAGSSSGNTTDVSNLIKPILGSGELTCIGSTTYKEYRTSFEKDHALDRRFQKIDIKEPTVEQTIDMLKGLRTRFETYHQVKFTDEALEAAARLSDRFISERHLPDKAIDLIDEVGAYQFLMPEKERKKTIDVADIEKMVAKIAHIPEKNISSSEQEVLKNLGKDIKSAIYGQDEAIDMVVSAIKLARSGLREANKPLCSFLFVGPTGVGKTEICNQLALLLGVELIRFDMSEYMEHHSAARLIGAPPGYVGYEEGGLLTDAVTKLPYSIILLDEIEKAHPDVFNLLLQIMDYGTLTDMNGRKADFRHTMLIMTSNAGADLLDKTGIGFIGQDNATDIQGAVQRIFSPEFRNRLDGIIQFKPLESTIIMSVVNKFIAELAKQLAPRNITLEVDENVRKWLALNGYDKKLGARPMARLIQEQIKKPLAEELLFGSLSKSKGGQVSVTLEKEKIKFMIEEKYNTNVKKVI